LGGEDTPPGTDAKEGEAVQEKNLVAYPHRGDFYGPQPAYHHRIQHVDQGIDEILYHYGQGDGKKIFIKILVTEERNHVYLTYHRKGGVNSGTPGVAKGRPGALDGLAANFFTLFLNFF
jgi:hypothetical protein